MVNNVGKESQDRMIVPVLRARAITRLCLVEDAPNAESTLFSGRRLLLVVIVPSLNIRRYWRWNARSMTHFRAALHKAKHVRAQSEYE